MAAIPDHDIYADADYPFIRLRCSCGEWSASVPVVGGELAVREAVEQHRRSVFGGFLDSGEEA